jgi:hypothetical protein
MLLLKRKIDVLVIGYKVYQLLAHDRWFSPASSTTKTGRHDIAEILLKMALKHQKSNQIKIFTRCTVSLSSTYGF